MKRQDASVEQRMLDFMREHQLVRGVRRLLVAVSGGPDSACLLHLLASLREALGVGLHVAHLDHQLRGPDSRADAAYVKQLSKRLGVPATIESRDVRTYRARHRISLEEAAREVRYAFFAEVSRSVGAEAVALGHTRDDNVETILMHIIRGTGTRGLRGLLPLNDLLTPAGSLKVVRPLLEVSRKETAAYCIEHGLVPRTDETNRSLSLFRNRVRLDLVPRLQEYNPRIEEALFRVAKTAGDELSFLNDEAMRVWEKVASKSGEVIVLNKKGLHALHPALKRHILRTAIGRLIGDLKDIEAQHIDELLEAIEKPAGRAFQLPYGLVFVVEYDRYLLGRDTVPLCPFPPLEREFALTIPGETIASGWKVTASVGSVEGGLPAALARMARQDTRHFRESVNLEAVLHPGLRTHSEVTGNTGGQSDSGGSPAADQDRTSFPSQTAFAACFDYGIAGGKLTVRSVEPGDRFEPMGLGASKKVGEFLLDAKVPRSWRKRVPIVVTPAHVAWVVGWRIDERVRVTDNTRKVLCLDFSRL